MTATTDPLSPQPGAGPRIGRIVANALLLACLLWSVRTILVTPEMQSDTRLCYHAVEAWRAGLDPYDPAVLSRVSGENFDTAYIYPPDTLPFYAAFSWFGPDGARFAFLGFQLALLAALLTCWQRFFLAPGDRFHPLFFGLCLVGLGNALLTDLRVGNISLLEQTLLWWGLAAWLRGRYGWFALLLCLASACKLAPLAFSVLLLLPPVRRWGLCALVWVGMAVRLGLDRLLSPVLFAQFTGALVGGFGGAHDGGRNNPCALEMLKGLAAFCRPKLEENQLAAFARPAYVLLVPAVLGASWLAWRRIDRRSASYPDEGSGAVSPRNDPRKLRLVFLVCLTYTLTVPRMKDYSYILLLPVVWRVGQWTLARRPSAWLLLVVLACLTNYSYFNPLQPIYVLLWNYLPYWIALVAWVLLLDETFRAQRETSANAAGTSP